MPIWIRHREMRRPINVGFLNEETVKKTGIKGIKQAYHDLFRSVYIQLKDPDRIPGCPSVRCINGRHGMLSFSV